MRAFLRLAAAESAVVLAIFGVIVLVVLFLCDFRGLMVTGEETLVIGLFTQWLVYGAWIGLAVAALDEARGTLDYAAHRGTSIARQAALRHAAVVPLLLALVVAAPILGWGALQRAFHPDAAAADWSRLASLAACGAIVPAAYGVGFWAGALRVHVAVRLAALAVVAVALWTCGRDLLYPDVDEWTSSPAPYVATMTSIFAAFVLLGHHAWAGGTRRDADRPLSAARAVLPGAVLALALGLVLSDVARSVQRKRQMSLHAAYPMAVRADGEVTLLSNDVPGVDGFVRVGAEHEPLESSRFDGPYEVLFSPWLHWVHAKDPVRDRAAPDRDVRVDHVPFHGARVDLHVSESAYASLDLARGVVRVTGGVASGGAVGAIELLPDGGRFSRRVRVLGELDREFPVLLLDDGAVWAFSIEDETASLERVPLPDGDRVVAAWAKRGRVAVAGERGLYGFDAGRFVPLSGEAEAGVREGRAKDEAAEARRGRVLASVDDPLRYDVPLPDEDVVLPYRPHTESERRTARAAEAAALLRPPVLLVAAALREPPDAFVLRATFEDASVFDPLVSGGKRLGLVGIAFAIAAGLGFVLAWRLLRIGVRTARVAVWVVVVLALGWPAFVAALLFETRRAWRWEHAVFPPAPPPRVSSARPVRAASATAESTATTPRDPRGAP